MGKKKVGIITFHRAINYGAVLQSYGLWAALKKLGADAWIVDYRNDYIENSYRLSWGLKKTYSGVKKWVPTVPLRQAKTSRFRAFLNAEAKLTKTCAPDEVPRVASGFDALITGSDQVFNPSLFGRDPAYLLSFAAQDVQRFSYAASLGDYRFAQGSDDEFIRLLRQFDTISVRESSALPMIQELVDVPVRVDVDPTLLLGRDMWNGILPAERIQDEPYIFCYSVHPFKMGLSQAKELSEETGYKVVFLHNRIQKADAIDSDGAILLHDSSPYDWLRLIRDAECVFTNSFHGTVFSTIFNTRFMSEVDTRGGFNNRIWRLLLDTGLSSRIVERCKLNTSPVAEVAYEDIDWAPANEFIKAHRVESIRYLTGICE